MTGKFGNIIRKAQEERRTSGNESVMSNQESANQHAGKIENQQSGIPDNQNTPTIEVDFVNLSIRVPRDLRQHWAAEAKRNGTSLTKEIIQSLEMKFGRPE